MVGNLQFWTNSGSKFDIWRLFSKFSHRLRTFTTYENNFVDLYLLGGDATSLPEAHSLLFANLEDRLKE